MNIGISSSIQFSNTPRQGPGLFNTIQYDPKCDWLIIGAEIHHVVIVKHCNYDVNCQVVEKKSYLGSEMVLYKPAPRR